MINKLLVYGFSEEQAAALIKGKEISVLYGKVKLNKKGELITRYVDKKRDGKVEQL